jgi:hypothetical protein
MYQHLNIIEDSAKINLEFIKKQNVYQRKLICIQKNKNLKNPQ